MKWQKRSAGKLRFLTNTLTKTPKEVKNGYFWSVCDPHGQPVHPIFQDLVQIVRLLTVFNNSKAKMLSFSFFFHYFLSIFMGCYSNPHFGPFYPLGDPPMGAPMALSWPTLTSMFVVSNQAQYALPQGRWVVISDFFRWMVKISIFTHFGGKNPTS